MIFLTDNTVSNVTCNVEEYGYSIARSIADDVAGYFRVLRCRHRKHLTAKGRY